MTVPPIRAALAAAVLWLAASNAVQAGAHRYTIDPVHSRLLFTVEHAGFSHALATLSAIHGRLTFDSGDWSSASVEAEIDLHTLDLGDPDWTKRVARDDFLDVDAHPVARFRSTTIEALDDEHARVHGELTLRGRSRPVTLEVTLNRIAPHPLSFHRTAGFSAFATLSREDFGMTAWQRVVGDRVDVRIELEAQRGEQEP